MNGYDFAFEHNAINSALAVLQESVLNPSYQIDPNFHECFVQAGWLATFLSNSDKHNHRKKALMFAALAKKYFSADSVLDAICYTIFSRVGALPAAMHLPKIVDEKQRYTGPLLGPLSDEFRAAFSEAYNDLGGGLVLTEFQKSTVELLQDRSSGILSAPTSAGKSFIVHEYVKAMLLTNPAFVALFVVPTKALIAQTCAIYRRFRMAEDCELTIHSSVPDNMERPSGPTVFALTQERCIRLLSTPVVQSLSLVFADEIQSLENVSVVHFLNMYCMK
tara:strand:+ start:243356 stop:244186 length:831 start_codon:yes stop_codon:yes gene_type:complete